MDLHFLVYFLFASLLFISRIVLKWIRILKKIIFLRMLNFTLKCFWF